MLLWTVIAIACISVLALTVYVFVSDESTTKNSTLQIAPLSIVAIELSDYNISTVENAAIDIYIQRTHVYKGILAATLDNGETQCQNRTLTYTRARIPHHGQLVRKWTKRPSGNISCAVNHTGYIMWEWTAQPVGCSQKTLNDNRRNCTDDPIDVGAEIYDERNETQSDTVTITFCNENDHLIIDLSITECLPAPEKPFSSIIVISEDKTQVMSNAVTLSFEYFLTELLSQSPKLYLNTEGLHNFDNNYKAVEILLQPVPTQQIRNLEIVVLAVSVLLLIFTVVLVVVVCCIRRKVNSFTIGLFYNKR